MGKLLDKAKAFLQTRSKQAQAFYDREHELKTKITELDAQKSKLINDYVPGQALDIKAIDKLDEQIAAAQKEIAVLRVSKERICDYNIDELIAHIAEAKSEISDIIAEKVKDEEAAREKILAAKKAFLQAQAEHFQLVRQVKDYRDEASDTLSGLTKPIQDEINRLRAKLHEYDREIYQLASTTSYNVVNGAQPQIDLLQEEKEKIGREINRLQSYVGEIGVPIPTLDNHRDGNGMTIYFIHAKEQQNAAERGELT
ncbi:hypothetical protein [Heyndrickxia sporothermodurans]|uniref:hypothetical protein n=1 Tax=Heyndrickxia sporothermodurans TaxID=46224 RepID=UPI0035D65EBD